MADKTVIFDAGMDTSAFTAAVDKIIGSLKDWQKQQSALLADIEDTETAIKENNTALSGMQKQLAEVAKTSGATSAEYKRLSDGIKILQSQNSVLNKDLDKQRKLYTDVSKAAQNLSASYQAAAKSAGELSQAGGAQNGKLFSVLSEAKEKAGNLVGYIAGQVGKAGGVIGEGLLKFGPWGAAAAASISLVVAAIKELNREETESERTQRIVNQGMEGYAAATAKATVEVDRVKNSIDLAKAGVIDKKEALDLYNSTLGQVLGTTNDLNAAEERTIRNADAYIQIMGQKGKILALQTAKQKALDEQVKRQLNIGENEATGLKGLTQDVIVGAGALGELFGGFFSGDIENGEKALQYWIKNKELIRQKFNSNRAQELKKDIDVINDQLTTEEKTLKELLEPFKNFSKFTPGVNTPKVVNIYIREMQKLKADIAKANESLFKDENTIRKQVEEEFAKRSLFYAEAQKKGQLSPAQRKKLDSELAALEDLVLNERIKDFNAKKAAFLQRIQDEINKTESDANMARIASLRDQFQKERETIEAEYARQSEAAIERREKLVEDLRKDAAKNDITEADLAPRIEKITSAYDDLLARLNLVRQERLQQLGFKIFQDLVKDAQRVFAEQGVVLSEQTAAQVNVQAKLYESGKISYKTYQTAITDILRKAAEERRDIERENIKQQIALRAARLVFDTTLSKEQRKQLEDEVRGYREQLASLGIADGKGVEKTPGLDAKIKRLNDYVSAVGTLANSVAQFWADANQREQEALDRSIAIQEKRIEAARRVAERGNAEYLKLEEERLKDLEVKRENAARRQLAINAVMQGSQILTALISGIAQGVAMGGPLGAIIGVAAVAGAIASGIALSKSLQPQTPSFFVGVEDTTAHARKQKPVDSRGGFHAVLHPGERVIPAAQNEKLKGLSNAQIVAISEAYRSKPLPRLNTSALDRATVFTQSRTDEVSERMREFEKKIEEQNRLQAETNRLLKNIGVTATMDQNGLALGLMTAVKRVSIKAKI